MSARQTILLVDDEDNDAILIKRALTKAGAPVLFRRVKDGEQAVQYLQAEGEFDDRESHPFPSLVILDLKMPRRNGFEVLKWMRKNGATRLLPVVVFTSSKEKTDIYDAYELGANSYMVKPNSFDHLVKTLQIIHTYWLELSPSPLAVDGEEMPERKRQMK